MDLVNLKRKDTDTPAKVKCGDLVCVQLDNEKIIGIVVTVDPGSMELQTADGQIRWVSRYVIYEKIQ
jgi:hypothetical protein